MGGRRVAWGDRGDAIFTDGLARGLTGEEISSAMRRAGVRGASPATVKRRMRERTGPVRTSRKVPRVVPSSAGGAVTLPEGLASSDGAIVAPMPAPRAEASLAPASPAPSYSFEGDPKAIVDCARARLARALGQLPAAAPLAELRRLDHHDAILATAAPASLAHLALYVTEDERTAPEPGEDDDEHDAFLEGHEADHVARARKILRDALAAIPAVHASHFTTRSNLGGS